MMTNDPYKKKDEQLFAEVQKLKDGDFSNSNAVYELSEKYIYKIINDILKNHHTTEDLMQEAYIQIYNKIGTLQEVKAFYVWAGRISTNLTLRYIQKNSKEVLATADEEGDNDFIFDTASEDNEKFIPESVLVDREKQRLIAEIIDKLSTEQKICIQYFYYEEMSVNQIAEAMGCSTGTIKSRLNYARKSIKEAVVELDEKHGTRLYSLASAPLFLIIFRAAVEGLLPAGVAGAASAAAVGGMAMSVSSSGATAIGGASTVGKGVVSGSVVVEKASSTSGVETVKNLILEKIKNIGSNLKADSENIGKVIKNSAGEHGVKIKEAFGTGNKEGVKQIFQSTRSVWGNTAKEFGTSTLATKVTAVTVAGVLVATPIIYGGGMENYENFEFTMSFTECATDAGILYQQFRDQINGEPYNYQGFWPGKDELAKEEDIYIEINSDKANDEADISSNSMALSEKNLQELISYGLQFKDCKGEFNNEVGVFEYKESVEHEIIIAYNGEKCICTIDEVRVSLDDTLNLEKFYDDNICYEKMYFISFEGTISLVNEKRSERMWQKSIVEAEGNIDNEQDMITEEKQQEEENNVAEDVETQIDITDPKYATTHPGVTGILDPSEIEGITVPELEAKLPTVEAIREIEQMQTILYVEYSRTNMTDEAFYSLMEQVPCTVYLQDGSSHSVTLAEFIFKDWSSYADLDKLDYDSNKARELSEGYKTTDSSMEK